MVRLQAPAVLTSSFKLSKEAPNYRRNKQRESKDRQRTAVTAIRLCMSFFLSRDKNPAHSVLIAFQSATETPQVSPDHSSSSKGVGHETTFAHRTAYIMWHSIPCTCSPYIHTMTSEATYTADPVLLKTNHVCDSEANNYATYTPDSGITHWFPISTLFPLFCTYYTLCCKVY